MPMRSSLWMRGASRTVVPPTTWRESSIWATIRFPTRSPPPFASFTASTRRPIPPCPRSPSTRPCSWMREECELKGAQRRHLPDKRMPGNLDKRPMVKLDDIHFAYEGGEALIRGATLSVAQGSVHAIVGKNHAGKTTLLKIAKGVLQPDGGSAEIYVRHRPVAGYRQGNVPISSPRSPRTSTPSS